MPFAHPRKNIAEFGLSKGDRVADFGAGPGHYAIAAAKAVGDDGHVYAIEIQKNLVDKITSAAESADCSNIDAIWGDLEKPEGSTLKSELVDAVIVSNVLFQVQDKEQFLREAHRVLKPGGRLLLIGWSDSHGGLGPQPDHVVNKDEALALARGVGFTPQQVLSPGEHHYGFVGKKN